ncbi:hypothetical protein O181_040449 [Austropuccinia psidii MF-1]|uniref:Uncharacterized protein n=1 Tax=Austropuccinia psidii MF-1 TaxID=1389203 RepID=A0A9Q3DC98_9BASI|nr:hypothetical protein [Austropuccinia psidii MF-1]
MNQQSTSELPQLPEDTVEVQYAEEDQTVQIQSLMKKIQDLLLTQSKKKGKRREQSSYTPGASPKPRSQNIPRRAFVTTPNSPNELQQKAPRKGKPVVRIQAKDYNLNDGGEEVEPFIRKVERIAQIEGETDENIEMQLAFWTREPRISDEIEAMPGYEEGTWAQLKNDLMRNGKEWNLKEDTEKTHSLSFLMIPKRMEEWVFYHNIKIYGRI